MKGGSTTLFEVCSHRIHVHTLSHAPEMEPQGESTAVNAMISINQCHVALSSNNTHTHTHPVPIPKTVIYILAVAVHLT